MRKSEIAVNQAHLSQGHCLICSRRGPGRPSPPVSVADGECPSFCLCCLSAHSSSSSLAADSWISDLSQGLVCGGLDRPLCWRHWALSRGEGWRRRTVMMSWCGGWGLNYPTPVMKQGCTESPTWPGGLFEKGRGQLAQTDTVLMFGELY